MEEINKTITKDSSQHNWSFSLNCCCILDSLSSILYVYEQTLVRKIHKKKKNHNNRLNKMAVIIMKSSLSLLPI